MLESRLARSGLSGRSQPECFAACAGAGPKLGSQPVLKDVGVAVNDRYVSDDVRLTRSSLDGAIRSPQCFRNLWR